MSDIAELLAKAGERRDILTEFVGTWVGFFEDDDTRILCAALRDLPGLEPWIEVGRGRFNAPHHHTPDMIEHASMKPPPRLV